MKSTNHRSIMYYIQNTHVLWQAIWPPCYVVLTICGCAYPHQSMWLLCFLRHGTFKFPLHTLGTGTNRMTLGRTPPQPVLSYSQGRTGNTHTHKQNTSKVPTNEKTHVPSSSNLSASFLSSCVVFFVSVVFGASMPSCSFLLASLTFEEDPRRCAIQIDSDQNWDRKGCIAVFKQDGGRTIPTITIAPTQ